MTGLAIGNNIDKVASTLLALIAKYGDTARVVDAILKKGE